MNKTALRFGALLACAMTFVPAVQAADKPQIDTGDTAWLLMATVLVLMMNIPGLALFYAGMVRKKNVLATSVQAFAVAALVTVLWFAVGYSLAIAMRQVNLFPTMVEQMTSIGEEAGALDTMLFKVAEFYEREVNNAVDTLTSLLEPFIIVIIGGMVGSLVIAMYLPIFKLGAVV
jgi:hypothetical protein